MSDTNPFAEPPVYEYDQVATEADLIAVYKGYLYQKQMQKWWQFKNIYDLDKYMRATELIILWIQRGKQAAEL